MTSLPAPDRLLADAAWLRRLARQLVGDHDGAADLQQDVALAALRQPEAVGRSWLAAVARNLAASLRRRRAVEQRGASALPRPEPSPSPDVLAAEAELQQRAVAAVLLLPQVYRDTVLLRFMQGLSVAATAAAMAVGEETVRTRQQRALRMLRAQLAPVRERRGVSAGLGSLVAWGVAMKLKHVVVAAAAVLIGALWATAPLRWGDSGQALAPSLGTASVATADAGSRADRQSVAESLVPPVRTEVVVPAVEPEAALARLTVRVRWQEDGTAAVRVPVLCRRPNQTGVFAITDAAGEVVFDQLAAGDHRIGTHDWNIDVVTLAAGERQTLERALPRGRSAAVQVLDGRGAAVAGATILVSAGGTAPQWTFPVGISDANGRCTCAGLRTYALVGARDASHGTSEFRMLRGDDGKVAAEAIVLRLPAVGLALAGRVVDGDGNAVGGAWVQVGRDLGSMRLDDDGHLWQSPPASYRTTAADGRFAVPGLSAGDVPLLVYHAGFAPHRGVVSLAANPAPVQVTLRPGGALSGTVRDAAGRAVAGADVELQPCDTPRRCSTTTGDDGAFAFGDLPSGEVTVQVTPKDLPRQQRPFTFVGTETQHWDVVVADRAPVAEGPADAAAIRGRLVDADNLPLADWFVRIPGVDRGARTDAEGRFVLAEGKPAGNTLVVRDGFGFRPERTRIVDVAAAVGEQTFVVPRDSAPSAWLRGVCVDEAGAPIPRGGLYLEQDGSPIAFDQDHCDADGSFAIGPLPKGRYQLTPQHARLVFQRQDVELAAGETHDSSRLVGARPAKLTVRLLGDPAACAAAKVELVAGDRRIDGGEADVRKFAAVFPGRYRLVVRRGGRAQDCGEIDLLHGVEVAREVVVP